MKQRFSDINEYYASGFFENTDATLFERYSRGLRRHLENKPMEAYNGELLYPCGTIACSECFGHEFSYTVYADYNGLSKKDKTASDALFAEMKDYDYMGFIPREHDIGGNMYIHSFPNFRRIIREGFNSYRVRVENIKNESIKNGLLDVLDGIKCYHSRALEVVKAYDADGDLYKAIKKVPFEPAKTLYEAIVAWNFIYYMDGCDNIGRLDADLIDFYNGEDMTEVFKCLFNNVNDNNGWSGALGPEYNELTKQCLKAIKGLRRPSLELRVTEDMPIDVWELAKDSICAGGGSPSLYNEKGYQKAIFENFDNITKEDALRFCGGGCTETMITGLSNVGSLDAGINCALVFERVMRKELATAESFDYFYNKYIDALKAETYNALDLICKAQEFRSKYRPHPMRTLLIDDCISNEKDFNAGGARYYNSVVNLAGLVNVIDSFLVINNLVFKNKVMTGAELLNKLDNGERFLNYKNIPRHGTDNDEANIMASTLSSDVCAIFKDKKPYLGGRFLPSSIQFTTFTRAGEAVGATPDGRQPGEPLCDSIGAVHNNDKQGITSLLNSAAALSRDKFPGTPVLNVKFTTPPSAETLRAVAMGYFENGGMQMQITCVNKEELLDAEKNPEKYPNLIVRIGGYSEYFSRLEPSQRRAVIERTCY